ncbi:hypothetical protein ESB13_21260 [Filimonas effusa]|uniref:Carboxypeptidase regulatory-like domain-containing protein n=2 Tax=Filimonas effusa TaxID=2508721 RepID=A0A4Q1D148_9BACT|nr:hypothetical protein ESB13_21260 [Filimonas effusa]
MVVLAVITGLSSKAQYVQPERDDTVRLMAKTPFDTSYARAALAKGTGTIKGVAFQRTKNGYGMKVGKPIYARNSKILLFPVTPYFLEFLELKKKENPKKLKFAYLSKEAWFFRLEAISNSAGEFTFPDMKPGKYYLECVLNWSTTGSYNRYTGTGYNNYGGSTNYYTREYYTRSHSDLLSKFVEITEEGQVLEIKLK